MRSVLLLLAVGLLAGCSLWGPGDGGDAPQAPVPLPYNAAAPLYGDVGAFGTLLPTAAGCPTEQERRADLLIQLHTEMMVTRLTCGADDTADMAYAVFTDRHQTRLREAQTTLEELLANHAPGNPARLFDSYRTLVANDESQTVIADGVARYCRAQGRLLNVAGAFTKADLRVFLGHALTAYGARYPGCRVHTAAAGAG